MGKTTKKWDRKFLGKLDDFESKEESKFEKKHLKNYLRGSEKFTFGKKEIKDAHGNISFVPDWHTVKQELTQL